MQIDCETWNIVDLRNRNLIRDKQRHSRQTKHFRFFIELKYIWSKQTFNRYVVIIFLNIYYTFINIEINGNFIIILRWYLCIIQYLLIYELISYFNNILKYFCNKISEKTFSVAFILILYVFFDNFSCFYIFVSQRGFLFWWFSVGNFFDWRRWFWKCLL